MLERPDELLVRLFTEAVPEIASGAIEIKAIARRPGVRAKVVVHGVDPRTDSIGICVGVRGARIKEIVDRLGGEKVDILRWSESPAEMIRTALRPAMVGDVVLDAARRTATIAVTRDQRTAALGRDGVNLELASRVCGWELRLVTP